MLEYKCCAGEIHSQTKQYTYHQKANIIVEKATRMSFFAGITTDLAPEDSSSESGGKAAAKDETEGLCSTGG